MTSNDDYVLQILQEHGLVKPEQIDKAAMSVKQEGETVVDVLIHMKAVTEDDVLSLVAAQFGMEMVHIDAATIPADMRDALDADMARKYGVVPLSRGANTVTVAISDPMNYDTLDSLRYVLKCNVDAVVARRQEIIDALDKLYPREADINTLVDSMGAGGEADVETKGLDSQLGASDVSDSDAPVIRLVSVIIIDAYKRRASDIHLEPMERRFRVRYRVDGVLQEMESPPKRLQAAIVSRIKIMAGMKISEKRAPQDGRIQIVVGGRDLDLRVSSVPTNHGESIVSISMAVKAMATPAFMSSVPDPHRRPSAIRQGMVLSVPSGQTVSRCPSSRMRLAPRSSPLPALGAFGPKRASSTLPNPRWRCSFTRPPKATACAAASATQASTADLFSEGDSARTSCSIRLSSARSLRRAPASSARIGTGSSGTVVICVPFQGNSQQHMQNPPDSTMVKRHVCA